MDDIFKLKQNNETFDILFKEKLIANISKDLEITIEQDYINSIRSKAIKKAIFSKIKETLSLVETLCFEDMTLTAIYSCLSVFNINKNELINFNEKELFLKTLNSLDYFYNNIWFSDRENLSMYLLDYFENNNDNENDAINALLLSNNFSNVCELIKYSDSIILLNQESVKLHQNNLLKFYDDYSIEERFLDINEVIDYLKEEEE